MFELNGIQMNLKFRIYRCLEHPNTTWHVIYHLTIFGYVLLTLCLSALLTLEDPADEGRHTLLADCVYVMEIVLSVYFSIEIILRLWAAGAVAQYQGFSGRLNFLMRFACIVDLMIVGATITLLIIGTTSSTLLSSATVQHLRFIQILRLLHVDRRATTWILIQKVLMLHKKELIAASYLAFLGLLVMTSLVYISETCHQEASNEDKKNWTFQNYGEALWWGVVTLTTIGYGDVVPKFWVSKLITSIFAVACVSLFTLTSSVIGVGLALMVQDKSRQKHMEKQRHVAAVVLQSFWRQHLLTKEFEKISFYRYNLVQKLIAHELTPFVHDTVGGGSEANGKSIKVNRNAPLFTFIDLIRTRVTTAGAVAGLSLSMSNTKRRASLNMRTFAHQSPKRKSIAVTNLPRSASTGNLTSLESLKSSQVKITDSKDAEQFFAAPMSKVQKVDVRVRLSPPTDGDISITIESPLVTRASQPTPGVPQRYKHVLRALWRMKFFVAKKKFKYARKPYDLSDISEEVNHSESAQLYGLKKIQKKLDRVMGKPQISFLTPNQRELGLWQRLEVVESRMAELDYKADLVLQLATQLSDRMMKYKMLNHT